MALDSVSAANVADTTNVEGESAKAYLADILRQYDLESLTDWSTQELAKGYDDVVVLQHIREQPAFQSRFKVIFDREKMGLPAMSPAEVIDYESQVTQLMVNAGMPKGFYDSPEDFADLMLADKSIDEVKSRVIDGYAKVQQAPQGVRDAFRDFYGPDGDNALAMFFLDPDKAMPVLETQMSAATLSGTGRRFGIGTGLSISEELARQGVTADEAESKFGQLQQSAGLFKENIDESSDLAIDKEGVEAAFGTNVDSQQAVGKRSEARTAAFAGSGGSATGQKGASGLGAANKP